MYSRMLEAPGRQSFFLFGPRGVGKTAWLHTLMPGALYFDLLDHHVYSRLLAAPERLGELVPRGHREWVVIDEVQRVPALLDEVHRLIESRRLRFALTGSSARKLRRRGVNLLAGRALTRYMHPLTLAELGDDFDLKTALIRGMLPLAWTGEDPEGYLMSYVTTYLREEVQQEGLTRNLGSFARFLEAASFSQGAVLNIAAVARECAVNSKVVEDYFGILEDLLISIRVPVFTKRARRRMTAHPKFYFFDAGVYRAIRPRGPLDAPEEIGGAALETFVLHELRAINEYRNLRYAVHYWRTAAGDEVDFILYGERGIRAIEVKSSTRVRAEDLRPLRRFLDDYPMARARIVYPGSRRYHEQDIEVVPVVDAVRELDSWL